METAYQAARPREGPPSGGRVPGRLVGLLVRGAAGRPGRARVLHRAQRRVVGHRRRHQADGREKGTPWRRQASSLKGRVSTTLPCGPEHANCTRSGLVMGTSPQAGAVVPPSTHMSPWK